MKYNWLFFMIICSAIQLKAQAIFGPDVYTETPGPLELQNRRAQELFAKNKVRLQTTTHSTNNGKTDTMKIEFYKPNGLIDSISEGWVSASGIWTPDISKKHWKWTKYHYDKKDSLIDITAQNNAYFFPKRRNATNSKSFYDSYDSINHIYTHCFLDSTGHMLNKTLYYLNPDLTVSHYFHDYKNGSFAVNYQHNSQGQMVKRIDCSFESKHSTVEAFDYYENGLVKSHITSFPRGEMTIESVFRYYYEFWE
ncbi:MAG: hypothetical protein IPM82_08130 [Saprospiraceae bacterium]|nr:hypothetical protein [Saprospiraceae bacterium]